MIAHFIINNIMVNENYSYNVYHLNECKVIIIIMIIMCRIVKHSILDVVNALVVGRFRIVESCEGPVPAGTSHDIYGYPCEVYYTPSINLWTTTTTVEFHYWRALAATVSYRHIATTTIIIILSNGLFKGLEHLSFLWYLN
jgi:hypothetical protein